MHVMNLHVLLIKGGMRHEGKTCQFVLQEVCVIISIVDDTASDKTREENHLK